MTFKTTQSNRFKPAAYEPKPMPKQRVWMGDVVESKTGKIYNITEYVLIMSAILLVLWAMDSLGWISVVKTLHP